MAKKVKGFEDFNIEGEKEKLQKIRRSFKPNSDEQQFTTNTRNEFDETTRKITAFTKDEVDDKLNSMDKLEESLSNEYKELVKKIKKLRCMGTIAEGVGYEYAKKDIIELIRKDSKKTNEGIFSDRLQQDNDDFYEPNKSSKMYSEEEVLELLVKMNEWPTTFDGEDEVREWFEEFKK